jgi:hypothetical protein
MIDNKIQLMKRKQNTLSNIYLVKAFSNRYASLNKTKEQNETKIS